MQQKTKDKIGRYVGGTLGCLAGLAVSDINLGGLAGKLGADPMMQLDILGHQGMAKVGLMNAKYGLMELLGYDPFTVGIGKASGALGIADWANHGMEALIANMSGGATLESLLGTGGYILPVAKAAACVGAGALAGVGAYYVGKYAYKAGKKIYKWYKSGKRHKKYNLRYTGSGI